MKINEDLWDNIKCTNIHIIGEPEGEERKKRPEKIFEAIIAENFPDMGKETGYSCLGGAESQVGKPKEEHTKTHSN